MDFEHFIVSLYLIIGWVKVVPIHVSNQIGNYSTK